MTKTEYLAIEAYMNEKMQDSAHDKHHVYRVLGGALDIANHETDVNMDVLIAACLIHDIGRDEQFKNPGTCHAKIGACMSYDYLVSCGWSTKKAQHVSDCISTHRFRSNSPPLSLEAKILFDSDKLEAAGLIGIARTLIYGGQTKEPLYIIDDNGKIVIDNGGADSVSFFQEYNFKLKNVYNAFYTDRAKKIAKGRQQAASNFYNCLHAEITGIYDISVERYLE